MKQVKIGLIGIDSGRLIIHDPAYYGKILESPLYKNNQNNNSGLRTLATNIGGDGLYDVYARMDDKGMMRSITIEFSKD